MTLQEKIKNGIRNVPNFPKEGVQFKDVTPLLKDALLSKEIIKELTNQYKGKIDAVAGIESRGFLYGFPLAMALGVPFILIRKQGKLPAETVSYSYDLEYGSATIEMHTDAVTKGMKVLIHDDLLATGGTAIAAAELVKQQGGKVEGFSFVINLAFLKGAEKLTSYTNKINSLVSY